jgi:hypothetical protein
MSWNSHLLKVIDSNVTAEDTLLSDFELFLYRIYEEIRCTELWTVAYSLLHEGVCRQRPEMWPIFSFSILTVFEVTQRSVSSSLCRKVEQQSIAVLHTTIFSRQCHCSTISVQIVSLQSLLLCTSSNCPLQYSLYNKYKNKQLWTCHYSVTVLQYVQCYHLPNCTETTLAFFRFITFLLAAVPVDSVARPRIV